MPEQESTERSTGRAALAARFGSAKHPDRAVAHARPAASDDATVAAVGKISAAFEVVENARGMLYAFHRMSGEADLALQAGLAALRDAGHADLAGQIEEGEFGALADWLREHLWRHGRKYLPSELVQRITGGGLDPEPYLRYLSGKYPIAH